MELQWLFFIDPFLLLLLLPRAYLTWVKLCLDRSYFFRCRSWDSHLNTALETKTHKPHQKLGGREMNDTTTLEGLRLSESWVANERLRLIKSYPIWISLSFQLHFRHLYVHIYTLYSEFYCPPSQLSMHHHYHRPPRQSIPAGPTGPEWITPCELPIPEPRR